MEVGSMKAKDPYAAITRKRLMSKYKMLYLFLIPGLIVLILFAYAPMAGLVMVFQEYDPVSGFLGSKFVGLQNFSRVFSSPVFGRALRNTLIISSLKLVIGLPMPVLFSLLLNELRNLRFKKTIQTMVYIPNFVSWVIVAGVWYSLLAEGGIVNQFCVAMGLFEEPVLFMQRKDMFYPIIILTDLWKSLGYNTIFYMSALASIPPEHYEASMMDGAGRFKQALYITLPALKSTFVLLVILNSAGILNAGFDQMWTMSNLAVIEIADILDTAVLRSLTTGSITDLSVGAALGFFKSIIAVMLFIVTNYISKKVSDNSLV